MRSRQPLILSINAFINDAPTLSERMRWCKYLPNMSKIQTFTYTWVSKGFANKNPWTLCIIHLILETQTLSCVDHVSYGYRLYFCYFSIVLWNSSYSVVYFIFLLYYGTRPTVLYILIFHFIFSYHQLFIGKGKHNE
jgi:hypothetical protein